MKITISTPKDSQSAYYGLFSRVLGTIENLTLVNIDINGSVSDNAKYMTYAGGFAGYAFGLSVRNCTLSSGEIIVTGQKATVGSLVGQGNALNAEECTSNIKLKGGFAVGGAAGVMNNGHIEKFVQNGDISGGRYIGGVVGYADYTKINGAKIYGDILYETKISNNDCIGGIAGAMFFSCKISSVTVGTIKILCKDWNNSKYQPYVGGFIGFLDDADFDDVYGGALNFAVIESSNLNSNLKQNYYVKKYLGNPPVNFMD